MGIEITHPTTEMTARYVEHTRNHIARVAENLEKVAIHPAFESIADELRQRAVTHDESKFSPEEKFAKTWLIERKRCENANEPFVYPSGVEEEIESAERIHVTSNRHHPEYHSDINVMTDVDIIEMVCDWTAMAQASGENNGDASPWALRVVGNTCQFDEYRRTLIFRVIELLDSQRCGKKLEA
jgi:hypothetical protein